MVDISKTYVNDILRAYGASHISEEAREYFIDEVKDYAEALAERTNLCIKNRNGKKIMKKDIKLALQTM